MYSPEVIAEGKRILALPYPPLPVFNKFLAFLREQGILYELKELHVNYVCCDPENRDKAMVVGQDAHENLKKIKTIGADLNQLKDAVAVEMPMDQARRATIIAKNEFMVETSGGTLAPLTGKERLRSIGCSHTSQSIRAAIHKCVCSIEELSFNGHMDASKIIGNDENLDVMFNKGWSWSVIPDVAAVTWPEAVMIGSAALNASNAVPTMPSETSCMLGIQAFLVQGLDCDSAAERILKRQPECRDYIDKVVAIAKLCVDNAADDDALVKLNRFAASHSQSKLGSDFLHAVEASHFTDHKIRINVRLAHMYCNMVSQKQEHGFGCLIKPSALKTAFKDPNRASLIDEIDQFFVDIIGTLQSCLKKQTITPAQDVGLQGRAFTRSILLLHKLEKQSYEQVEFGTLDKIKLQFKSELLKVLGKKAMKLPWELRDDNTPAATAAKEKAVVNEDPPSECSQIAAKTGFKVGGYCYERIVGLSQFYVITDIGDDVHMDTIGTRLAPRASKKVSIGKLIDNFVSCERKNVVMEIPGAPSCLYTSQAHDLKRFRMQARLLEAIISADASFEHGVTDFIFMTDKTIRAGRDFDAGDLRLAPVSVKLEKRGKEPDQRRDCSIQNVEFALTIPQRPETTDGFTKVDGKGEPTLGVLVPFWWVGCDYVGSNKAGKGDYNMRFETFKGANKSEFPILTNPEKIKAGATLRTSTVRTVTSVLQDVPVAKKSKR